MLLQNAPNGLLISYRFWFQPQGRDFSAARWARRCGGKPPRARRPIFVVRRTSASCNLTVGSWKCRQAATGQTRTLDTSTSQRVDSSATAMNSSAKLQGLALVALLNGTRGCDKGLSRDEVASHIGHNLRINLVNRGLQCGDQAGDILALRH
jgi:hypothetical protein